MSRASDCNDDAVVESFFGTLEAELVRQYVYPSRDVATAIIGDYIETSCSLEPGGGPTVARTAGPCVDRQRSHKKLFEAQVPELDVGLREAQEATRQTTTCSAPAPGGLTHRLTMGRRPLAAMHLFSFTGTCGDSRGPLPRERRRMAQPHCCLVAEQPGRVRWQ